MTMKKLINNILLSGALAAGIFLTACSDDDAPHYLIDFQGITTVGDLDTQISEAALGDFIAIHGKGLDMSNIDSVLIDDIRIDLGEAYAENNILYLKIPVQLPVERTDKIYIYNRAGVSSFPFHTVAPDLKLERMFNEFTAPGDTIMIYGDFFTLYEIEPEKAVVDFDGIEMPVISSGNNYLTAQVPENVSKDIRVNVRSLVHGVEAQCPGKYYDQRNVMVDYDTHLSTNTANVVTDPSDSERLSGNFLRIDDKSAWSGWWYISESWPCDITDDMLDHPENYEIKCEFRTSSQLVADKIGFHVYLFWDAAPIDWLATDFNVQNFDRWETIRLPFVVNRSATYTDNSYYKSFNIRLETYEDFPRHFAFDNFRIVPKGD